MPLADSKPTQVTYLPISTPEDMVSALQQALSIAYYGIVTMNAAGEWSITLSGPGNVQIDANLGEVLIWNGKSLAVLNNDEFMLQYQPK